MNDIEYRIEFVENERRMYATRGPVECFIPIKGPVISKPLLSAMAILLREAIKRFNEINQ